MPYKLRKAPNRDLYWVVGEDGKKHSKEPIPKERAEAQMRALYSAMNKEGGAIPSQYVANLSPAEKKKQIALINKSKKDYEKGVIEDRPTVSDKPTKRSKYVVKFENKYGFPITDKSKLNKTFPDADIEKILAKGVGAYGSSGSRPNVSRSQWAYARLASVLTGGPALRIDKDLVGAKSMAKITEKRGGAWYDVFTKPIPRTVYQQVAQQSYENLPQQTIGGFELIHSTPTIKFYKKDNVILVGIRGTLTQADWTDANARIAVNQLENSQRFQEDLKELLKVQAIYPPSEFVYYGAGHSLGGAMLDGFLQMGLIQSGVSYNPAIQPKNFKNTDIQNERIFAENDPLYNLSKPFLEKKPEVRPANRDAFNMLVKYVPYAGTAYDLLQGHRLTQFEGGGKDKFMTQLRKAGLNPSVYLKKAQKKAKDAGYGNGAKLLGFASDGVHKLAMPNEDGKLITFGRVGYGDHLIWSHLEKTKQAPQGIASKKQNVFQKSHSKIKGDWKADPFSPNNLALRILW
jgi:hypothetical protein